MHYHFVISNHNMRMQLTNFSKAIMALSSKHSVPIAQIARRSGVHHTTLSRTVSGTRPDKKTLKAVCNCFDSIEDGLDLLIAHLHDEVARVGFEGVEITIKYKKKK